MSATGELDKGLVRVNGAALISHVITRLSPQVNTIIINANRHLSDYAQFGYTVISDDAPNHFFGPLAGLNAVMKTITTPLIAVVPCDAPRLPPDLVARLSAAINNTNVDLVYATTLTQEQPTFFVLKTTLSESLATYLASGQRSIKDWFITLGTCAVSVGFNAPADADAFTNLNTADDIYAFEQSCRSNHA